MGLSEKSLDFSKSETRVVAAEAEGVGETEVDRDLDGFVRGVVQVALRVRGVEVDGRVQSFQEDRSFRCFL